MSDKSEQNDIVGALRASTSPWGTLMHYYGPLAFGLVCVLCIWQFIMQPQLDAKNLDYEEHRKIIATMHDTAAAMSATANTMESTSQMLDRQSEVLKEILIEVRQNRNTSNDP